MSTHTVTSTRTYQATQLTEDVDDRATLAALGVDVDDSMNSGKWYVIDPNMGNIVAIRMPSEYATEYAEVPPPAE
jgi:hypothetical protein